MSSQLRERLLWGVRVALEDSASTQLAAVLGSPSKALTDAQRESWEIEGLWEPDAAILGSLLHGHQYCDEAFWKGKINAHKGRRLGELIVRTATIVGAKPNQLLEEELLPIVLDPELRSHLFKSSYGGPLTPDTELPTPLVDQLLSIILERAKSGFHLSDLEREHPWDGNHDRQQTLFQLGACWLTLLSEGLAIGEPFEWLCLLANLSQSRQRGPEATAEPVERVLERLADLQRAKLITSSEVPGLVRRLAQAWDTRQLVALDRSMTRFLRYGNDELFRSLRDSVRG
jgi:hypothetical protein